jgi:hypothetical protein
VEARGGKGGGGRRRRREAAGSRAGWGTTRLPEHVERDGAARLREKRHSGVGSQLRQQWSQLRMRFQPLCTQERRGRRAHVLQCEYTPAGWVSCSCTQSDQRAPSCSASYRRSVTGHASARARHASAARSMHASCRMGEARTHLQHGADLQLRPAVAATAMTAYPMQHGNPTEKRGCDSTRNPMQPGHSRRAV